MAYGWISRIMAGRGYGFIQEAGSSEESIFHWTSVRAGPLDQLKEGQAVEFDKIPDHRDEGRSLAVNVRLVSGR